MSFRLGSLCGVIAAVFACSANSGGSGSSANDVGTTGMGGSGSGGQGSNLDGGANPGSGGNSFGGVSPAGSGGDGAGGDLSADAACGATVLAPEGIEVEEEIELQINCTAEAPGPISLYIMLDNSGSMDDNDKWEAAVAAITEFVGSDPGEGTQWTCTDQDGNPVPAPEDLAPPGAGTINVAIQYFHPEGSTSNGDECDGSAHRVPAVEMGSIPDIADAIVESLADTGPSGYTPTVGALTGSTQYCATYNENNSDTKCVVVLVTDGVPYACGLDGDNDQVDPDAEGILAPIAQQAFTDDGVLTFTVGMDGVTGDGFDLLDAIAVAGGSDCTPDDAGNEACNVSSGSGQNLLGALNTIRENVQVTDTSSHTVTVTEKRNTTLPCEWTIPEPPAGRAFDKDLVNVTITTASTPTDLLRVPGEADCAAAGGGWYYDDPATPARIHACPATCQVLELLSDGQVQVLFGCATEEADIR